MATPVVQSARKVSTSGSSSRGSGWLGPFRALRHRNYRLFFAGQFISLIGTWIQVAAVMWLAYQMTGTSRWPAIIAASQMAPAFLLGAWGGVVADRYPRRRLMFLTQSALMALAFLLAWIVWTGEVTVWHLLAVSLGMGVVNALDLPARLAFLVELVGKDDLINAVGLNSLLFNLARAAGPAFAVWLLPLSGPEFCFFLNGLSYVAILIALSLMRLAVLRIPSKQSGSWIALREGFRYVSAHPVLSMLLPLTVATSLFGWPILSLLPAKAEKYLHAGESGYSSLLSSVGVGALIAAFLVATFGTLSRRWQFIRAGVVVASLGLIGLSLTSNFLASIICSGLVGMGLVFFFATSQAMFQVSATEANRGRVMGIYSIVLTGANPLGNLLAGPAADQWGELVVLRFQGIAILSVALLVMIRRIRKQVRDLEVRPPDEKPNLHEDRPLRRAA